MNDTLVLIIFMAIYAFSTVSAYRIGHAEATRKERLHARRRRMKADRE